MSQAIETPPRRRNRNWVWVFGILLVLGVAAVSINWIFNVGQPLTKERLQEARNLWKQHRPNNYNVRIIKTSMFASVDGSKGTTVDEIVVHVRDRKITAFFVNGKEPEPLATARDEQQRRESYDMDGLYDSIEEFLRMDERENKKSFMRARFHKSDGRLTLFTRQVNGLRSPHLQVEVKHAN